MTIYPTRSVVGHLRGGEVASGRNTTNRGDHLRATGQKTPVENILNLGRKYQGERPFRHPKVDLVRKVGLKAAISFQGRRPTVAKPFSLHNIGLYKIEPSRYTAGFAKPI
jgi:hypothetical protein